MENISFKNVVFFFLLLGLLSMFFIPNLYLDKYLFNSLMIFSLVSFLIYIFISNAYDNFYEKLYSTKDKTNEVANKNYSSDLDNMIDELDYLNETIDKKFINYEDNVEEIKYLVRKCSALSKEIDEKFSLKFDNNISKRRLL